MHKVLIIDDEVLVRVGLKTTIDWEKIGFSVVAEASNGEQGYEKYIQHSPHVIITDIKMPRKDGLWLIEKIREKNQDAKIIVLTCFDEFSYAQKALRLGADDYILKSEIEDEELIEIMKKTKSKLADCDKNANSNELDLRDMERIFMADLIKNEFVFDTKLQSKCATFNLPISDTKFCLAVVSFSDEVESSANNQVNDAIQNIISDQLLEKSIPFTIRKGENDYFLIFMSSNNLNISELKIVFKLIGNATNQYFSRKLNFVYTDLYRNIGELHEAYLNLMNKSQILFYDTRKMNLLVNASDIEYSNINIFELGKKYNSCFRECIIDHDNKGIEQMLHETNQYFEKNKAKPKLVKIFYSNLIGEIFNMFEPFIQDTSIKAFEYYHETIGSAYNIKEISNIIIDITDEIINKIQNAHTSHSKLIMKKTIDFINKNYDEKISLEDVAEAVNVSKHYLCSVFKKETGENMSLYINKLRIERSKIMLLNPDYKVKDVFDLVGFSNQQYFSKVFKKITGKTIMEYKDTHNK